MRPLATDPIYAPPWHDHDHEYGPGAGTERADPDGRAALAEWERERKAWVQSIEGGGLWDDEQYDSEKRLTAAVKAWRRAQAQIPLARMVKWAVEHSEMLTYRGVRAALMLAEGKTGKGAARERGVAPIQMRRGKKDLKAAYEAALVTGPPCHGIG